MNTLRENVKFIASQIATLAPQARFDRGILVLSHMRSATTAITNVLCSHPSIIGYGETHVAYNDTNAPGAVMVNLALRRAYSLRAPLFTDKILHNRLDKTPPDAFFGARGLFLARQPAPAIRSITQLAAKTQMDEVKEPQAAALYYAERLERLIELWDRFPASRRCGFEAEKLLLDPDATVSDIGSWIGLSPVLENKYVSHAATQKGGGGDPTRSAKLNRIEKSTAAPVAVPYDASIPVDVIARCEAAHRVLVQRFDF